MDVHDREMLAKTLPLLDGPMKISYIIADYNVPQNMLDECLESIHPSCDYEIILIDDGSTEPVKINVEKHGDRLRLIRTENGGLSVARNLGLTYATGEYIHFVDADDALIYPQYDSILRMLQEERPDLLSFHFSTTLPCTENLQPRILRTTADYILRHTNLRAAACTFIFRREALGDLRFAPGIQNEDERFTPQLYLRVQKVVATDIRAYYYRQRSGSLQNRYEKHFVDKRLRDFRATIAFLKSLEEPALRRRIFQLHIDYLIVFFRLKIWHRFA